MGIMEKKMEATIFGVRAWGFGFRKIRGTILGVPIVYVGAPLRTETTKYWEVLHLGPTKGPCF